MSVVLIIPCTFCYTEISVSMKKPPRREKVECPTCGARILIEFVEEVRYIKEEKFTSIKLVEAKKKGV